MEKKPVRFVVKLLIAAIVLMLIVYIFMVARDMGYKIFSNQAKDRDYQAHTTIIEVDQGDTVSVIAQKLYEEEIVDSAFICSMAMRTQEGCSSIMPGEYKVSSDMTPSELVKVLSGNVSEE